MARHLALPGSLATLVLLTLGPAPAAAHPPGFTIDCGAPCAPVGPPLGWALTPDGRIRSGGLAVDTPPQALVNPGFGPGLCGAGDVVPSPGYVPHVLDAGSAPAPFWADLRQHPPVYPAEFVFESHSARFLALGPDAVTCVGAPPLPRPAAA